jgi:tRNA A-37 threonylcarbamoyl transferase component Bud32
MTDTQFLTTPQFLKGQLLGLIKRPTQSTFDFPDIPHYTLVKKLKKQTDSFHNSVGLYADAKGRKVIIKHLWRNNNSIAYYEFLNEINMLKFLNSLTENLEIKTQMRFPKLIETQSNNSEVYFVMEYIKGDLLRTKRKDEIRDILIACLDFLAELTAHIPDEIISQLPKRTIWIQHFSLPIYFLKAVFAKPRNCIVYLQTLCYYYWFALQAIGQRTEYNLSHKDLHQDNVIIDGKKIIIIDPQVAVLAEKYTDLAIIARLYLSDMDESDLIEFLHNYLRTTKDKSAFLRLSIYFAFQLMGIKGEDHKLYPGSMKYLQFVQKRLVTQL